MAMISVSRGGHRALPDLRRVFGAAIVVAAAMFFACPVVGTCLSPPGDITGDGSTTVVDVQCAILTVLQQLAASGPLPPCLPGGDLSRVDLDCNGIATVTDVQLVVSLTITGGLPPTVDANGDSCADACQDPCVGASNGTVCNDGNPCTTGDNCVNGQCVGGAAVVCDDANPCTTEICNPVSGCVSSTNTADCSDGNPCTTGDKCSNGVCSGVPVPCDDFDPCTIDACNPATGGCVATFNAADPQCAPIGFAQVQDIVFSGTCAGCHGVSPQDSSACNAANCDGGKCFAAVCEATQCGTTAKGNAGLEECEQGSGVFLSTAECIYERAVRGFPSAMPPAFSGIVLTQAEKKAISAWWHSIEGAQPSAWCPPPPVSYASQIQPIWNKWCTSCHGANGGLNLAAAVSHQNLVNVNSSCNSNVKRVLPGSTANSMLWRKLANLSNKCGGAMPTGTGLLAQSPAEAALVEQWILQGAVKN